MGCTSCSSGDGIPKGCKSNGSCSTGGCEKLTVFDWLSDMELPSGQEAFSCVEVRFKNGRKEYFSNTDQLKVHMGDTVAVEGISGHDIGIVSLSGELVRIQMRNKGIKEDSEEVRKLYRKANQNDIDTWQDYRSREDKTMFKARKIADELKLQMKISDVEYQGDGSKAIFYYTAEDRVDFRMLIKQLASEFRIRVEMKQIGSRQEAGRLGGIGSCGRELCCSTWLTDFRSVSTSAARYQQLSLNPQKLAGQCGKLKCCLNYELDSYIEAVKEFPANNSKIKSKKGEASLQKIDIFKRKLWYSYVSNHSEWVELDLDKVKEIIAMNKKSELPEKFEDFQVIEKTTIDFTNVVGQEDLTRFDNRQNRSSKNKRRKKPFRKPIGNRNQKKPN